MLECPIKNIRKNIFLTKRNEGWGCYKVGVYTAGLNSQEGLDRLRNLLKSMADQLQKFKEIDYKIIPIPKNISKIIDETAAQYQGQYRDIGYYYSDRAKKILNDEIENPVDYKFFVFVKLKETDDDERTLMNDIRNAVKNIHLTIQQISGINKGVAEEAFKRFKASEQDTFSILSSLDVERCTEDELRYILRYQFLRGHNKQWEGERSLYALTEGILDKSEIGYYKIQQLESESYVSFLPVSMFPIDMSGTEWANAFQRFPFPVEMNIRTIYLGKEKDLKETIKMKKRFREQDAQLIEANEDEDTLINEGRQLLFELENDIKNQNKPLVRTHVHFVVWGTTKAECRSRVKDIKQHYKGIGWEVVQPMADQDLLFHQSIPGADIVAKDWEQQLTPESFAESFFSLTRKIGNNVGFYLGKDISLTGESLETSRQLIFFNPFAAVQGLKGSKYSSPHLTISGPTGLGKSMLAKNIGLNAVFYGAKLLVVDPKNEWQKMIAYASGNEYLQKLLKSFNFITFTSQKEDAGKLDPLTFLEGEDAHDAATTILEYLLSLENKERSIKTAISEAVRNVSENDKKPGLLKVVKILQDNPEKEIKDAGDYLYELGTNGIAKLLFSNGNVEGISLNKQVNILQIQNLKLPKSGVEKLNKEELVAVALMIPLAKFTEKFTQSETEANITIFEEVWMLSNTGQGEKLIKGMLRTGRSLQSAVYLVTQSITSDFNKAEIKEGIGTKFVFKAKTTEEASVIIEYLGLEDNSDNRKMLKNLSEGECVMEDIYGRSAKIKTDVLYAEWEQAFNTKPSDKKMVQLEEAMVL